MLLDEEMLFVQRFKKLGFKATTSEPLFHLQHLRTIGQFPQILIKQVSCKEERGIRIRIMESVDLCLGPHLSVGMLRNELVFCNG